MIVYELTGIKKIYNERLVLDISQLKIESGLTYSLIGPNGAGKTTLLNILGFLTSPISGQFLFKGNRVLFAEKQIQPLRRQVVLVNQHPILFSSSVYQNVEFGLKIRKTSSQKRKEIVEKSLELVGMQKFIYSDARCLSGGETRRVALARALACSPEILLLDEPTADLDLENQYAIENIVKRICRQNKMTIIFCTHNLRQAARLTDKKICLMDGKISETFHENIFSGTVVCINNNFYFKIVENILIPIHSADKDSIKISIAPNSIRINEEVPKQNDVNLYHGKVFCLDDDNGDVRISIDIGIPISLLLKKKVCQAKELRIGDDIAISFDMHGVQTVS